MPESNTVRLLMVEVDRLRRIVTSSVDDVHARVAHLESLHTHATAAFQKRIDDFDGRMHRLEQRFQTIDVPTTE